MTENAERTDYEAQYKKLMRRPIPREGFIVSKHPLRLRQLRQGETDDPFERWLAAGVKAIARAANQ